MKIEEKTVNFPMSRREFNLIREMAGEFMLDFPEATDVEALVQRLTDAYFAGFEL